MRREKSAAAKTTGMMHLRNLYTESCINYEQVQISYQHQGTFLPLLDLCSLLTCTIYDQSCAVLLFHHYKIPLQTFKEQQVLVSTGTRRQFSWQWQ